MFCRPNMNSSPDAQPMSGWRKSSTRLLIENCGERCGSNRALSSCCRVSTCRRWSEPSTWPRAGMTRQTRMTICGPGYVKSTTGTGLGRVGLRGIEPPDRGKWKRPSQGSPNWMGSSTASTGTQPKWGAWRPMSGGLWWPGTSSISRRANSADSGVQPSKSAATLIASPLPATQRRSSMTASRANSSAAKNSSPNSILGPKNSVNSKSGPSSRHPP